MTFMLGVMAVYAIGYLIARHQWGGDRSGDRQVALAADTWLDPRARRGRDRHLLLRRASQAEQHLPSTDPRRSPGAHVVHAIFAHLGG